MEDYWRQQYEAQMHAGKGEYGDVLAELTSLGLPAEFTQTGGLNAAIEVQLVSTNMFSFTLRAWRGIILP